MSKKRICIDLDGVINNLKNSEQDYSEVAPVKGAVDKIQKLKENGHYIIIFTARHMKTCDGNIDLVIEKIGSKTIDWLSKNNIPYDEIHFGKPWADIYIDDNGFRFKSWDLINDDGSNLPESSEKKNIK